MTPEKFLYNNFGVVVSPIIDGRIHRFKPEGAKDCDGWYVFFQVNDFIAGSAGDWRNGEEKINYRSNTNIPAKYLQTIANKQKEIEKEQKENQAKSLADFISVWNTLSPCENTPYFERKGVKVYGDIRQDGNVAIIPIFDSLGNLVNRQAIFEDGAKRFGKHLQIKEGRFIIPGNDKTYLCEGYATGASIHEATDATVVVCFSASNLSNVAPSYPNATIVADNDESETGEKEAKKTNLSYILIPDVGMDANDYAQEYGLNALKDLLEPNTKESWLEPIASFLSDMQPPKWLIKNYIPAGPAYGMIYGPPASGKSFIVLDMMMSVAYGLEWHGYKVKQGNVLYILGEGRIGMKRRMLAWIKDHNLEGVNANIFVSKGPKDMYDPKEVQEMFKEIAAMPFKPDWIVIDTLNRCFSGNENDAQDVYIVNKINDELSTLYNSTSTIVHHTGVSENAQNRARGSSALRGAVDFEIKVNKEKEIITVSQTKQKDIELLPDKQFSLKNVELPFFDEDGEQIHSAVVTEGIPQLFTREMKAVLMLNGEIRKEIISGGEGAEDMGSYYKCSLSFLLCCAEKFFLGVDGELPKTEQRNWIRNTKGGAYSKLFPEGFIMPDGEGYRKVQKTKNDENYYE